MTTTERPPQARLVAAATGMLVLGLAASFLGGAQDLVATPRDGSLWSLFVDPPWWVYAVAWTVLYPTIGFASALLWHVRARLPLGLLTAYAALSLVFVPVVIASDLAGTETALDGLGLLLVPAVIATAWRPARCAALSLLPLMVWSVYTFAESAISWLG